LSAEPVTPAADLALVKALEAGDETAFEEIFRRYHATVYGVLLRLTGSPEEAEDLTQEVFLRLHAGKLSGADPSIGGWLYRVATNLGFNAVRSRRRRANRLLRWARLDWPLRPDAPSAAAEAERRDDADLIRQALAHLSERDRTALILRYSGVSYAEIADAIGVKPNSVGTILVRAERALRQRFAGFDPGSKEHDVAHGE
jgi:RNA polymerase sigma-70 factor (ECF subfamily)